MDETPPFIDSFVIRFVHLPSSEASREARRARRPDGEGSNSQRVRGTVRHVQSNREKAFTDWEEVEAFIRQYVPSLPGGR